MLVKKRAGIDWYEETQLKGRAYTPRSGCCLLCEDSEDGCLCINCRCTRCCHYDKYGDPFKCDVATEFSTAREREYYQGGNSSSYKVCEIARETEKAYLAKIQGLIDDKEIWIPKSVVDSEGYIRLWFLWKLGFKHIRKSRSVQLDLTLFLSKT